MPFTESARALLRRLEGCRLAAYQDQAGVWTIGYGHTVGVKPVDVWTQEQADAALDVDLQRFTLGVQRLVAGLPLTDNRFSALVIFAYNVGLMALAGSSALRVLRAGNPDDVPDALARWNKIHDRSGVPVVNAGLVARRAAEAQLWSTPDFPKGS